MRKPTWDTYLLVWATIIYAIVFGVSVNFTASAQSDNAQPVYVHNACAGDCVADTVFIHSAQGDTMAENSYNAWMNTYWELTGCDDSLAQTSIFFLLDFAAEVVEAPGATTMQCWQGLGGIGSTCNTACNNYSKKNGAYAPNVYTSLQDWGQGWANVTIDNSTNVYRWDEGPDSPNAYSRKFTFNTYLQYQDGPKLLVYSQDMPSLSFPNWITRRGVDNCNSAYGAEDIRCQMLSFFDTSSQVTCDPTFGNGALYNLTGLVSSGSGMRGSQENGYVLLATDNASVNIKQGPYTVNAYVWTHNKSKNTTTTRLIQKDASASSVSFSNQECNSIYCGIVNNKIDRDTYVFILDGPEANMLLGDYHVSVEAEIVHDKDTSDNSASFDYTVEGPPPPPQVVATPTPIDFGAMATQDVGPGSHSGTLSSAGTVKLYRFTIPVNISSAQIELTGPAAASFHLFTLYNQPPVQSYPYLYDWEYDCWDFTDGDNQAFCQYNHPYPGDYYFAVIAYSGSGDYTVNINLIAGATATPTPAGLATATTTPTATLEGTDTSGQNDGQVLSQAELEPNNDYDHASSWNILEPIQGKLDVRSDMDMYVFNPPQSGIYDITLSNVPANIKPDLIIYRSSHVTATSKLDAGLGETVTLGLDANQGETFYIKVKGTSELTISDQAYILTATIIPDPQEPNDILSQATSWDAFSAPIQGYFYELLSGPADIYTFTVPETNGAVIATINLTDVATTVKAKMILKEHSGLSVAEASASSAGQPVSISFDANPGETYYVSLIPNTRLQISKSPYTLSLTTLADASEPNDVFGQATIWDYTQGPIQGYFFERISGPGDYYKFTAPAGTDPASMTISLTGVDSNVEPLMFVYRSSFIYVTDNSTANPGEPVSITFDAQPGATYYVQVKPKSRLMFTTQPYTLTMAGYEQASGSQDGQPDGGETVTAQTSKIFLGGVTYQGTGLIGLPLSGVNIFARINTEDSVLLGSSDFLGLYTAVFEVADDAAVQIWAEKDGYTFEPSMQT